MDMPLVNVSDLEARWRPLKEDERTRAAVLLQDAESLILSFGGDLETLNIALVTPVVCAMVKRVMATPADQLAVGSTQITAGPFSETLNYTNPTGDLYLTKAEKYQLGIGRQRMGSVAPHIGGGRCD